MWKPVFGSFTLAVMLAFAGSHGRGPLTLADVPQAKPVVQQVEWLHMLATAYTAGPESTGKSPGDPGYGITKTGTVATQGRTIAVDPAVIPLGTEVSVWYDHKLLCKCIAEDTGRLIIGNHIDIFMDRVEDAVAWGRRYVEIEVPP